MIQPCKIRNVKPEDFQDVFALLQQLWETTVFDEHKVQEIFTKHLHTEYKRLICAEIEGKIVGFCSLTIKDNLRIQGIVGYIDELVILREYRGLGIGQQLMKAITAIAMEARCTCLELDSAFFRKEAHQLYKNLGFDTRAYLFTKSL